MTPLTIAQKHSIRTDRIHMSAIQVARKWGISRARVYQLMKDNPADWKVFAAPDTPRVPTAVVPFRPKLAGKLANEAVQSDICSSTDSDAVTAKRLGVSEYAVARVRYARLGTRT